MLRAPTPIQAPRTTLHPYPPEPLLPDPHLPPPFPTLQSKMAFPSTPSPQLPALLLGVMHPDIEIIKDLCIIVASIIAVREKNSKSKDDSESDPDLDLCFSVRVGIWNQIFTFISEVCGDGEGEHDNDDDESSGACNSQDDNHHHHHHPKGAYNIAYEGDCEISFGNDTKY